MTSIVLCVPGFASSRTSCKWNHTVLVLCDWLVSLSTVSSRLIQAVSALLSSSQPDTTPSCGWIACCSGDGWVVSAFDSCQWRCCERQCAGVSVSRLWGVSSEWNCRQFSVWPFEELPACCPQQLHRCSLSPAAHEGYSFYTSHQHLFSIKKNHSHPSG